MAFGVPAPAVHGRSLWPLLGYETARLRDYACSGLALGDSVDWALRTPEWHFVLPRQVPTGDPARPAQLYVKPDDRWEVNNVAQHHLELTEQLEATLHQFAEATRRPDPFEPPLAEPPVAPEGGTET